MLNGENMRTKIREIPMLDGYPDTLTITESEAFPHFHSFDTIRKAYNYTKRNGGQIYTQTDSAVSGDVIYQKGNHTVNRTGFYIVVKR